MVEKNWNLSADELEVLATDKPFMDKVSEIVDLTDEEMALIDGGGCGCGYGHRRFFGYGHRRFFGYGHRRFFGRRFFGRRW
jgi:hypothetical protein